MKSLAGFVMSGRPQAALVAAATALLSLLLPLFGLVSGGALSLVTLRRGAAEGAVLAALATVGLGLLSVLTLGSPWPALGVLLVLWAPALGLAVLLRWSRSLAITVQAAGLAGVVVLLLVHALVADPETYWQQLLAPLKLVLTGEGGQGALDAPMDAATADAVVTALARWMTGAFAAALVLQWLLGLFIGRWWQALLYNPGGFGSEFRELRLHRGLGVVGLVLVGLVGFTKGPGLVADLLVVLFPLYLLQGLAVLHALHHQRKAHGAWLFALYLALIFFMPHAALLVACIGLSDIWVDIRGRLVRRPDAAE